MSWNLSVVFDWFSLLSLAPPLNQDTAGSCVVVWTRRFSVLEIPPVFPCEIIVHCTVVFCNMTVQYEGQRGLHWYTWCKNCHPPMYARVCTDPSADVPTQPKICTSQTVGVESVPTAHALVCSRLLHSCAVGPMTILTFSSLFLPRFTHCNAWQSCLSTILF